MSRYLVGLQTIQTGASKQGDSIVKYQLGSHLIRKGNTDERKEVKQKYLERTDPNAKANEGENFGGQTMSLMVAGVMDTSISVSDFLDSLWIQNSLIAFHAGDVASDEEVFFGAFEISTPKPDAPALNLLLYYRNSQHAEIERLASAIEARILPGLHEMSQDGIAFAGQILPAEKVRRRITADREYLYGKNDVWGAYALKIRFPKSREYDGYIDGGACLGIHLDDLSYLPFERIVKLVVEFRTVGSHAAERIELQEKVYQHYDNLEGFRASLVEPGDRILSDIVADVIAILSTGTIYDRKLARWRDFWKKIKGN